MELEAFKPLIFLLAIVIGQVILVYIPYRNKRIQDGRKFDMNYVYTLLLGFVLMAVISVQSATVQAMPLSFDSVFALMFVSGATQTIINKATPKTALLNI